MCHNELIVNYHIQQKGINLGYLETRRESTVGVDLRVHIKNCFHFHTWVIGVCIFILGVVGVLGDAVSTMIVLNLPYFSEISGGSAAVMSAIGLPGWAIITTIFGLLVISLTLAKPKSTATVIVFVVCSLFVLAKLLVFASNIYQYSLSVAT